ncbi:MAG: ABC transporter ATP-binding protein [Verrucomicrobia bacterium]|nr:ABC transporter ATP-binding protein [Verrucomicrobiota bacterium]
MISKPNSTVAVDARKVTKRFGELVALNELSLAVDSGQCVGLLGPNGAGKSTFIGCLYGSVERSEGDLRVFGFDPAREARRIKERIGVVPQENALDEELTVRENMRLYARFQGVKDPFRRIEELLEHMSLSHKSHAQIRSLSGGMKRRLTFVRALLSDPELLILDEPTTGLDPTVRHLLWDKVLSYRQVGKTVLVTTHYMHEAELLCDRVIILNHGVQVAVGSPKELIEKETPGFVGIFEADQKSTLKIHLDSNWHCFMQGRQYCVRAPQIEHLIALQAASGVMAIQMRPANLEDVYLKLTGEELGENE